MDIRLLGPIELAVLPLLLLLVAFLLYRAQRITEADLQRWAKANGVSLGSAGPRVRRYLAWTRRCRAAGFLGGILLSLTLQEGLGPLEAAIFGFVGYLLGALVAELLMNRPAKASGIASLKPRVVTDYVPLQALSLFRSAALVFIVLEGVYAFTPVGARITGSSANVPEASPGRFLASTLAVGLLIAGIEGVLRLIVSRRQSASSAGEKVVDDVLRSTSAHAITAGGLGLMCLAIAGEAMGFAPLEGPGGLVAQVVGALAIISAFVAWFTLTRPRRMQWDARVEAHSP